MPIQTLTAVLFFNLFGPMSAAIAMPISQMGESALQNKTVFATAKVTVAGALRKLTRKLTGQLQIEPLVQPQMDPLLVAAEASHASNFGEFVRSLDWWSPSLAVFGTLLTIALTRSTADNSEIIDPSAFQKQEFQKHFVQFINELNGNSNLYQKIPFYLIEQLKAEVDIIRVACDERLQTSGAVFTTTERNNLLMEAREILQLCSTTYYENITIMFNNLSSEHFQVLGLETFPEILDWIQQKTDMQLRYPQMTIVGNLFKHKSKTSVFTTPEDVISLVRSISLVTGYRERQVFVALKTLPELIDNTIFEDCFCDVFPRGNKPQDQENYNFYFGRIVKSNVPQAAAADDYTPNDHTTFLKVGITKTNPRNRFSSTDYRFFSLLKENPAKSNSPDIVNFSGLDSKQLYFLEQMVRFRFQRYFRAVGDFSGKSECFQERGFPISDARSYIKWLTTKIRNGQIQPLETYVLSTTHAAFLAIENLARQEGFSISTPAVLLISFRD